MKIVLSKTLAEHVESMPGGADDSLVQLENPDSDTFFNVGLERAGCFLGFGGYPRAIER